MSHVLTPALIVQQSSQALEPKLKKHDKSQVWPFFSCEATCESYTFRTSLLHTQAAGYAVLWDKMCVPDIFGAMEDSRLEFVKLLALQLLYLGTVVLGFS